MRWLESLKTSKMQVLDRIKNWTSAGFNTRSCFQSECVTEKNEVTDHLLGTWGRWQQGGWRSSSHSDTQTAWPQAEHRSDWSSHRLPTRTLLSVLNKQVQKNKEINLWMLIYEVTIFSSWNTFFSMSEWNNSRYVKNCENDDTKGRIFSKTVYLVLKIKLAGKHVVK